MTDLQVRRVRFDFANADVPFNWQPERPAFGMQCNVISFFAPGFEKFIVEATREAIPLMRSTADVEEAEAYLMRWIRNKYKRLRPTKKATACWQRITSQHPRLFAHWAWVRGSWWTG